MKLRFWNRRTPVVASPTAREALGIVDPEKQAFEAVKLAIVDAPTEAESNLPYVPAHDIPVSETATRAARIAHLKKHGPTSEYHLALASGIMDDLSADIAKLESQIAEHEAASAEWVKKLQADIATFQKDSADKAAAMRRDVADKRKALAFWRTAPDSLGEAVTAPTEQAALPKPKRPRKPAETSQA